MSHCSSPSGGGGKPALTGTVTLSNTAPQVGDTLKAEYKDGNGTGTAAWQWLAGGKVISGANAATYTAAAADLGKTLAARVSFDDQDGVITSNPTGAVTKTTKPALTGTVTIDKTTPKVGETLTAEYSPGNGTGGALWQWLAGGTALAGANSKTYTAAAADLGKTLTARVSFADQSGTIDSDATAEVAAPSVPGMVWVSGGTFEMGTPTGKNTNERPIHSVTLSGFYMGKYEVTQEQYEEVMGSNPSYHTSGAAAGETQGKRPVEQVSWYDAVEYCNKLSIKEGLTPVYEITNRVPASGYPITSADVTPDFRKKGYRLPTEAEWEYAARGGNKSQGYEYSGSDTAGEVAWIYENSEGTTHEVGKKAPNELDLYDMSGNVVEWCWDWYGTYPDTPETNPVGASSGSHRVFRGGCWFYQAEFARSAIRAINNPFRRDDHLGFRVVRPQF